MNPRIAILTLVAALNVALPRWSAGQGNDAFANRVPLSGASVSAVSTTSPITLETGEPVHAGSTSSSVAGSLWWSWTAPSTGTVNFSSYGGNLTSFSSAKVGLAVYAGSSLASLTEVGSTNNATSTFPTTSATTTDTGVSVDVPVVSGTVYQIAIAGYAVESSRTVLNINRAPTIVSGATASGALVTAFSYRVQASNAPSSYAATGLPMGLSFNSYTGQISGKPLETGTFLIPLEAANSGGTGYATLTLRIAATSPPTVLSAPVLYDSAAMRGTVGVSFSRTLSATGSGLSFSVGELPAGLNFVASSKTIGGVPQLAGIFPVSISASNAAGTVTEIVTLTIEAAVPIPVISSLVAANGTVGADFSYFISASETPASYGATNLPPGLTLSSGRVISGRPTTPGVFTVPLSATNSSGTGTAILTLTINPAAAPVPVLQITSRASVAGVVGTAFTHAIVAGSGATTFSASGLPPGLGVNAQTGYITGVPTTPGVFLVPLTAGDGTGTTSATMKITITAKAAATASVATVVFTSSAGAIGYVGSSFSYLARASSDANSYSGTYSASGLPPGLVISTSGSITGTPTAAGTYPVNVSASLALAGFSSNATGSAVVTIRILAAVPPPTTAPLIVSKATASGVLGASFSYLVSATGSPTSYAASGLPAGLSVNTSSGAISGTPTATGVFPVTLTATNAIGSGSAIVVISIDATLAPPEITSNSTASGTVGVAFSYSVFSSTAVTSYSATNPPPGLTIDPTGQTISGTPTVAGIFLVPISASNAGGTTNGTLTITIAATRPAPEIYSDIVAAGQVGAFFSYTIGATNTPTGYAAGDLPAGLSFETASGRISGTPTAAGIFRIPISATNPGGTATATLTVTIAATGPLPVISCAATAAGTVGSAFTFSLTASNSPTAYTASNLPPGLALNTATGAITGTPTAAGVFSVPFSAEISGGSSSATLTITIGNPAAPLPPVISSSAAARGVAGTAFSYSIVATNSPTSFTASNLPAGLTVNSSTGVISGIPTAAGLSNVAISATNAGGTVNAVLTLAVSALPQEPPVISSSAAVLGQTGEPFYYLITASNLPTSFSATSLPAGLTFDPATGIISGIPTTTGSTLVPIAAVNAVGTGTATVRITVPSFTALPRITSSAAAAATVGTAFSYQIAASRAASSYSAPSLPAGLTVSTSTGLISGTPTTTGTFSVTISAFTSGGTASGVLRIFVGAASPALPIISSPAGMNAYVGEVFGYRITASNAPVSFAATGLPAGLSLNTATGWISGVPTTSGTTTVSLSASNGLGTGTASLKIAVSSSAPSAHLTSGAAVQGLIGVPLTYRITASTSTFSYSATSALPAGLTLNTATGSITGTPIAGGLTAVAVSASTSSSTLTGVISFSILAAPLSAPTVSSPASAIGAIGSDFLYAAAATNQPTAFTAANLPPGLSLDAESGLISGRPTASGTFAVSLSATNALGQGTATVTLVIAAAPPAPVITNAAAISALVGANGVLAKITATNSPGAFTATGLPPGVTVDPISGVISGTTTAVGVYAAQVTASNATGTASATLTFTIGNVAAPKFVGAASRSAIVGVAISSSTYVTGTSPVVTATGLPPGLSVNSTSGVVEGTPTTSGVFPVQLTATNAGGSVSAIFTISIASVPPPPTMDSGSAAVRAEVGTYLSYYFSASSNPNGVPLTFTATGLPPGLGVISSSYIAGTPTTPGSYSVLIAATSAGGTAYARVSIVVASALPPAITSALGATGVRNTSFSYTIAATHTPTAFSAGVLPPGLSLNASSGVISGTPSVAGDYLVSIGAANSAGTGNSQIRISVLEASNAIPTITSVASTTGLPSNPSSSSLVDPFSYSITATGFPSSFTATGLPPGLSLNPWTGVISGAAALPGVFPVAISATGAAGTATATLTIVVSVNLPVITNAASVVGHVGVGLSARIYSSDNQTNFGQPTSTAYPAAYGVSGLPPGLSVNTATGTISGTPRAAGLFLATISIANLAGTTTAPLTFIVDDVPPMPGALRFTSGVAAANGAVGAVLRYDFWLDGLPTDLAASTLPPGLTFSKLDGTYNGVPTKFGRITGTPTVPGIFTVPIFAQNASDSVNAVVTFVIAAAPRIPIVSSYAAVSGNVGARFTYSIYDVYDEVTADSPVGYAAASLPAGLTFNSASGAISGTPQVAGTFLIPISETIAGVTGTAMLTLTINPAADNGAPTGAPSILATAATLRFVGVPSSLAVTATNAPDDLIATGLPPGIVFSVVDGSSNGVAAKFGQFTGVPTTPGVYAIPISATSALGTGTAVITITVVEPQAVGTFITVQPADQSVAEGQSAILAVSAIGLPAPGFQWLRDGIPLAGATASTLTLDSVTLDDAASYSVIVSNSSGVTTSQAAVLTVTSSYDAWKTANFSAQEIADGDADGMFDFNRDGTSNLLDYALRRNPRTGSGGSLPTISLSSPANRCRLSFLRDTSRIDLSYIVEASDDLVNWTAIAASVHGASTGNLGGAASISESGNAIKSVTVEDAHGPADRAFRFLRLKVARP